MQNEYKIILEAVREAGAAILTITKNPFFIKEKSNKEIVTDADLLVNHILKEKLFPIYPNSYWLSEENSILENNNKNNNKNNNIITDYIWIIDPIDGTKEYVSGIPEYAISVALIKNQEPLFSVVFNPATNELFYAIKAGGAYLNNHKIVCRQRAAQSSSDILLLVSRSEYKRGEWDHFSSCQIKPVGSIAYKMAMVAAGFADGTITKHPRNIWDVAAGILLVTEAEGKVTNYQQENINFSHHNTTLVKGIIASHAHTWSIISK